MSLQLPPNLHYPCFVEVFECLLAKRLYIYTEHTFFPNFQFGFQKGLGACHALLTTSNVVQKALDSGHEVQSVTFLTGQPNGERS